MVLINNVLWKIEFVSPNDPVLNRNDGTFTFGVTDLRSHTISIASTLKGAFFEKVLTHELCHACIFSYGIYMNEIEEERLCDFVASHGNEVLTITENFEKIQKEKLS